MPVSVKTVEVIIWDCSEVKEEEKYSVDLLHDISMAHLPWAIKCSVF